MEQPPRPANASLFSGGFSFQLAWQGVLVGLVTLAAYFLGEYILSDPGETYQAANTMAFATLTLCQLFHAYDVRSDHRSIFEIGILSNPSMTRAFLAGSAPAVRRTAPATLADGLLGGAPERRRVGSPSWPCPSPPPWSVRA